ncbi:MAG: hypothetical protein ABIJ16_12770 [Bacteroidota bacterium]
MKKILILFLISCFLWSCGKYEEGPSMSFRSKQKRIEGLWQINKILVDGTDSTSFFNGFFGDKLDIKDGNWELPRGNGQMGMGGNWNWYMFKYYTEFYVDYAVVNGIQYQTDTVIYGLGPFFTGKRIKWEIVRIANKELILESEFKDMIYRFEMTLSEDYD